MASGKIDAFASTIIRPSLRLWLDSGAPDREGVGIPYVWVPIQHPSYEVFPPGILVDTYSHFV